MGKRSRDVSFSPSGNEEPSNTTGSTTSESDDLHATKLNAYENSTMPDKQHAIKCSMPPHPANLEFQTVEDFELHYAKEHINRCLECGKNLPSAHFLNLHLDENHNPVREALAAQGEKTYACFLPDCEKKCSTPHKRRMHLIDKHHFPKVYNFRVVNNGIDHTNTLLQDGRRRRVSLTNDQSVSGRQRTPGISKLVDHHNPVMTMEKRVAAQDNSIPDMLQSTTHDSDPPERSTRGPSVVNHDIDALEHTFAALHFVPRSVKSKHGAESTTDQEHANYIQTMPRDQVHLHMSMIDLIFA